MKHLFLFFIIFSSTGCSSFYYFPTREEHVDRAKLPMAPEDVDFVSEDGTKLHGWYFKSQGEKAKGAILFFHGNAQNITTHFVSLYAAPKNGYAYFIFDYRGYGKSEGAPTPAGTIKDGKAALRWLKKRHPDLPIIIFGQSLGGAVALKVSSEMKDEVPLSLIVVDSTFASYRSVARATLAKSWITWLLQPVGWLIVDNSQAPRDSIKTLSPTPLVVIHGRKDTKVPFEMGQDVFENAIEPKEFWEIPNGRHTDFMWQENGIYAERFFETLGKHTASK